MEMDSGNEHDSTNMEVEVVEEDPNGEFFELITMCYNNELSMESNCQDMARKISSKESTLVALIEALGPRLTSKTVQDRVRAMDILSSVFSSLRKDFLSEKELEFIVEFLLNRLKDQHLVVPKAILGIFPIVQCQNLPRGSGAKLLHQIFQEANVQSHVHKIRRTVFLIIEFMLRTKLDELEEMSSDFVINFLQAIDGEKDPRNLLLLFQIIPIVISNFSLGPFIEDFFEVLACYFPVDFAPTVTIPGADVITREGLAEALHISLSHTNQFSEFLVPLALEKLDSTLHEAKIDSLRLLEICCERCYQPKDLEPFLQQIWHSLRKEIFMGGNEAVETKSIDFLRAAFKVVSRDEDVLRTCIDMVFTECKHHLCEPELRLIHPTSKILIGICDASEESCKAILPPILSVLQDQLTQKSAGAERKRILGIIELVISSCRQYTEVNLSTLLPNWDEIRATWFTFLSNDDMEYANLCLKILLKVFGNKNDFGLEQRHLLQEHLIALLDKSLSQDTLGTITTIAEKMALFHGTEFLETSVPKLLESISFEDVIKSSLGNKVIKAQLSRKVLAECAPHDESVCEKVVSHLLTVINQDAINTNALKCLRRIVEKVCESKDQSRVLHSINLLVEKLLVVDKVFQVASVVSKSSGTQLSKQDEREGEDLNVINSSMEHENSEFANENPSADIFQICVSIIRNLTRASEEELQKSLADKFWTHTVNDSTLGLFFLETPLVLIEAILGPLRPSVRIFRHNELAEYLLQSSVNCEKNTKWESTVYRRLLAVFLNKLEPESEFLKLLEHVELQIETTLKSTLALRSPINENKLESAVGFSAGSETISKFTVTGALHSETVSLGESVNEKTSCNLTNSKITLIEEKERTENTIKLLAWVIKALAMRGIKRLDIWMEKLINLLTREDIGMKAADGFNILLADDLVSLNSQSHCNFRFLYKQRCFQMSVPKLVKGYREAKVETSKANFIQALSSQLKHIPKEILAMEIENVFPLLVASLKFNSSSALVVLSTLNAFEEMMNNSDEETDKRLVEYCHDIVPQLVKLASFKESMEVRKLSLKCLQKCAKCPSHVILPLKQSVVDHLWKCLDDPKRLVRKEASLARNIWLLIGSPGGL